jgi:4-carboxymuconolactone decarboxylase
LRQHPLRADPSRAAPTAVTPEDVRTVAPALKRYCRERVLGEAWKRSGLSPRDRGGVTLAALIARNQTIELPAYLTMAIDNGVKPREISEIITHLAFYSGWANALSGALAHFGEGWERAGRGASRKLHGLLLRSTQAVVP